MGTGSGDAGSVPTSGTEGGGLGASGGLASSSGGVDTTAGSVDGDSSDGDSSGGDTGPPEGVMAEGWIVYFAPAEDGGRELRAVVDDGSRDVLMMGSSGPAGEAAISPRFSWDEQHIAFVARANEDGPSDEGFVWVMDVDGSNAHVAGAISDEATYRIAWASDSERLYYSVPEAQDCEEDIVVVDADGSSPPEIVLDLPGFGLFDPITCPADSSVMIVRAQACGSMPTRRLVNLDTGETELLDALPAEDFGYDSAALSSDCSTLVFTRNDQSELRALDLATGVLSTIYDGGTSFVRRASYGNGDARLYMPRCIVDDCDVWVVDPSGQDGAYRLGVVVADNATSVSWRDIEEPDEDGDGIADGAIE